MKILRNVLLRELFVDPKIFMAETAEYKRI
jgi:hypothetical protein